MTTKFEMARDISKLFSDVRINLFENTEKNVASQMNSFFSEFFKLKLVKSDGEQNLQTFSPDYLYEIKPFPMVNLMVYSNESTNEILVIGPVLSQKVTQEDFFSYMEQRRFSPEEITTIWKSVNCFPWLEMHKLYKLTEIMLFHLFGIDRFMPIHRFETNDSFRLFSKLQYIPEEITSKEIKQTEERFEWGIVLNEAVKSGNLSLALQILHNPKLMHNNLSRSDHPLRSVQNDFIVLNARLKNSLEMCEIHPYLLDRLSTEISQKIERLTSTDDIIPFASEIAEKYCQLVNDNPFSHLSNIVKFSVAYINSNLSDKLAVKDTAERLYINADYLCHHFSREMGMTFIDYVNQQRCMQASSLLKHTNLPIKDIGAMVGYNTMSYFAKKFIEVKGKNPREYRNERRNINLKIGLNA